MQRWRKQMTGFSLMEMLVVLMIIGILYGVASLSFKAAFTDPVTDALRDLQATLRLTENEATIRSTILGVYFDQNGYRVLERKDAKTWQELSGEPLLVRHALAKPLQLQVLVDGVPIILDPYKAPEEQAVMGDSTEQETLKPQVVVLPTGEMSPFKVVMSDGKPNSAQQSSWDDLGRVNADAQ